MSEALNSGPNINPHPTPGTLATLRANLNHLLDRLPESPNGHLMVNALASLVEIGKGPAPTM